MEYKLSELFELQMGKTPERNNGNYWENGTENWIAIADLSKCNKYINETKEKITFEAIKDSGIKKIPKNTVVMSFKLSIGKVAITQSDIYSNEAIMAFINKGKVEIEPTYLYYLFLQKNWNEGTNKAVLGKTLNKATLSQVTINIHRYDEQLKIIHELDKVNDIINARKMQLERFDTLIKSRFVEMFGDPKINNLKIHSMPMTEVCDIIDGDRGKNYPTQDDFSDDGYCLFLNAKNVTKNGFLFENCMFISKEKEGHLRKGRLNRGDIVLTTRGTIGNLAFYDNLVPYENVRINSGMVILRMKHEIIEERFFIEQFKMQLISIKEKIASGSAQPQLPISTMNKIELLVPTLERQIEFADFVQQVDKSKVVDVFYGLCYTCYNYILKTLRSFEHDNRRIKK